MRRRMAFACAVLAMVATTISGTTAFAGNGGFTTSRPSMLTPMKAGVTVTPLLTVGDVLPSGFRFEAIPDGISLRTKGNGRVDLFVNHETSKVPFPFGYALNPQQRPSAANGESDFDNSQVSRLMLNQNSAGVLNGSFVVPSSGGFQRFCSNYLATSKEGFDREILFTNEESPDYVFRQEDSWPPPMGDAAEEENGVVIAVDVKHGRYQTIYGMGRHNHENNVAIPGFTDLVVLSGDDTFTSGPLTIPPGGPNTEPSAASQSQLYSYIASDTDSLLDDEGDLWAFVSDNTRFDDYYDFVPGSAQAVSGHFIPVPKNIATGKNSDGSEVTSADVGYPAPPTDGSWQRDLRTPIATGIDGPQWVLEYWSQLHNVFDFVRVEDIAYDKRPGMGNVVYVVDSGRGTAGVSQPGRSTNGRVWKMVLDANDPTVVTSLSIAVEGDDNPVKTLGEIHQPDNIETTQTGFLVTEDPGSSQQFVLADQGLPNATTARLWYVPFSGSPEVVVKIDQSADGGPTDVGPAPTGNLSIGNWGAWETTGIVDASAGFGPGAFLINVQAHTLWVEKAPGTDSFPPAGPDFTYKREGGQLLLLRIPGV
ncbi:MAG TPA: hypothetical protein VJZ98_09045 [Actinomycetota bacterium]|nr:hypothetical protein [Actinomycetota bacterium]